MPRHKKTITLIVLASFTILFTAANITPGKKYKNLKVLPKDISEKQLDSIMKAYTNALQVSCDFCHKPQKDIFNIVPLSDTTIDYALDNGMKEYARKMIRLTIDINKNYFRSDSTEKPEYMRVVSCNTCHRGNPFPADE